MLIFCTKKKMLTGVDRVIPPCTPPPNSKRTPKKPTQTQIRVKSWNMLLQAVD